MNSGRKRNPFKSPLKAVMIYLTADNADRLTDYAKGHNISASKIAREGIDLRLNKEGNVYDIAYNEALDTAIDVIRNTKGAQMMFPSGKSFAELVCENIEPLKRKVRHEG